MPEHLVLFDLDGTLTLPRQEIDPLAMKALYQLWEQVSVGIVTGSNIQYVQEQLSKYLKDPKYQSMWEDMLFLPCNGTQQWTWEFDSQEFTMVRGANMREHLGEEDFRRTVQRMLELQCLVLQQNPSMPVTGEFIQYRDSMINWCPIGRSAKQPDRDSFKKLDKKHRIRELFGRDLRKWLLNRKVDVTVAFGGNTSFDIYPNGWDKSYVLDHLDHSDYELWFVGDRCTGDGNDRALYDVLPENRRWQTKGPSDTVEIIMKQIIPGVASSDKTSFNY